jgi:hypothetical protein
VLDHVGEIDRAGGTLPGVPFVSEGEDVRAPQRAVYAPDAVEVHGLEQLVCPERGTVLDVIIARTIKAGAFAGKLGVL